LGRFVSEDPLIFGGGSANFYTYALNNPSINVDPSGELVEVVCVPVEQKHAGIITGARHCAIHVKYDDIDTLVEQEGPTTLTERPQTPRNTRMGLTVPLKRPEGGACRDFEKCVLDKFRYHRDHIADLPKYHPVNSNSNAFARDIIRECGGDVLYPHGFTWKYGYNFFGQMPE
jgi:hypothetical protein